MTSPSPSSGYIDFASFGISDEDLVSLRAAAPSWQAAVLEIMPEWLGDAISGEFIPLTARLPVALADTQWQQAWLRSWYGLVGRGVPPTELFRVFHRVVVRCEQELVGDTGPVSRLHYQLFACLRRGVLAAVSSSSELAEAAHLEEQGLPGELAALRWLRELQQAGRHGVVLSLSLVNRDSLVQLPASDLQRLPAMLAARIGELLHRDDRVFAGREAEWLLVMPDISSMIRPGLAAAHMQRVFAEPLQLFSGHRVVLRAAIGAARWPEHGADPEAVLQAARLARWNLGDGEPFACYDVALLERQNQRLQLADELCQALADETLMLYLQPQVDLASGRCFAAELLLRWQRRDGCWVPPGLAIDLIGENGWRSQFTDWLLRSALHFSETLAAAGCNIRLSLNLTAADLLDDDLAEMFAQRLATWQLSGERFTLELTESALLADRAQGLAVMHRLRQLGCRLALDDFGTGYSSLSYLVSLPINEIKIDRSFVVAMFDSEENLRIVHTIIDLAHDLGMQPLAEGVENAEQRAQLLALGCPAAQGFLYAPALPIQDFIAWHAGRPA